MWRRVIRALNSSNVMYHFHIWAGLLWGASLIPSILWWHSSVLWVIILSWWALVATHWAAWQAVAAQREAERGTAVATEIQEEIEDE